MRAILVKGGKASMGPVIQHIGTLAACGGGHRVPVHTLNKWYSQTVGVREAGGGGGGGAEHLPRPRPQCHIFIG